MSRISVGTKRWRLDRQLNFARGFGVPARDDSEADQYENFELARDGTLQTRLGNFAHNTNDINGQMVVGIGRASIIISAVLTDLFIVAKKGTQWWYAVSPFNIPEAYVSITALQDPGILPVRMDSGLLTNETPVAMFVNENFSPGLMYWDGAAMHNAASAPAHTRLIRQVNQHTYVVTKDLPNRIYFSDEGDPTSWPTTNFFDISPARGPITAIERNSGMTLLVFTDRSIQGVFGDPTQVQGFNVEMLHDSLGCDTPQSVYTLGSVTIFAYRGSLFSFSGSIQEITEQVRGITRAAIAVAPTSSTQTMVLVTDPIIAHVFAEGASINSSTGHLTTGSAGIDIGLALRQCTTDPFGRFVYIPDPTFGVWAFTVNSSTGALSAVAGSPFATGGPTLSILSGSNTMQIDNTGNFLIALSRVTGKALVFSINQGTGALTQVAGSPFLISASLNLSSLAKHPTNSYFFATDQTGNLAISMIMDQFSGAITVMSSISGGSNCNSCVVSPDGNWFFVVNSASTINSFAINNGIGTISAVNSISPTTSCLKAVVDSTSRFLFGYGSGTGIEQCVINQSTGALTDLGQFATTDSIKSVTAHPTLEAIYAGVTTASLIYAMSINAGLLTLMNTHATTGSGVNNIFPVCDNTGAFLYCNNVNIVSVDQFDISPINGDLTYTFTYTAGHVVDQLGIMSTSVDLTSLPYNTALFQSWAAMTPWHILYRPCMNTKQDGSPTSDLPCIAYAVDRERSGWWSVWNYPPESNLGPPNPYQAVVSSVDNLFLLAGADGQVYAQPVRQMDQDDILGIFKPPQFTQDDDGVDVTSVYRSRMAEQGDPMLVKQCRFAEFIGICSDRTAKARFRWLDMDGNYQSIQPFAGTNKTLPFEVNFNLSEIPISNYFLMQVQLTASNLWLRGYGVSWRGVRWSGRGNLNP